MTRRTLLSLVITALLLALTAACSRDDSRKTPANAITDNDFEQMRGWLPAAAAASLSRDRAHSGHYALKVDAGHEFSLTYDAMLGDILARKPRGIQLEAWVWIPSGGGAGAQLVTVVGNPGATPSLAEDRVALGDVVSTAGEWVHVSRQLALPATVEFTHHLTVYLWRGSAQEPAYLDDLRLIALY